MSLEGKQKFAELVKLYRGDVSFTKFARKIGVDYMTVTKWENGLSVPDAVNLSKLGKVIGFSVQQLLDIIEGRQADIYKKQSNVLASDNEQIIKIPLIDMRVGAGNGCTPNDSVVTNLIEFPRSWYKQNFSSDPNFVHALIVSGDSMSPTLNNGDLVLIDRQDLEITVGMYVFRYEGDIFVKRLSRFGKEIQIISDNPSYPPFTISLGSQDFEVCGKVIFQGKKS
jgi:phage repressor protein C with HTH and peptisase S24 domain